MKVFLHHLYEYRKGLRSLVLHTLPGSRRKCVQARLAKEGIAHVIHELSNGNINVFFGAEECVAVVRAIGKTSLSDYTPEEDFILARDARLRPTSAVRAVHPNATAARRHGCPAARIAQRRTGPEPRAFTGSGGMRA